MSGVREWLDLQDSEGRKVGRSLGAHAGSTVATALIVVVTAYVPYTRDLFQLDPGPPALLYGGLLLIIAIPLALYERSRAVPQRIIASIEVVFALGIELFAALLVTYSQMPGSAVLAAIALFAPIHYGHVFRVSVRYPWHAAGTVVVFAVAALLAPDRGHLAIFAVIAPTAVAGKLLLGTFAHRSDQHRAEAEQLRAAVHAQMLDDQSTKIAELADMLLDVVSRNHDVRNAVMAAHVGSETLQVLAEKDRLASERETVSEIARNLESSLDRVSLLLNDISDLGRERLAELAPDQVRLKPVLGRLVSEVQRRFPAVGITLGDVDGDATVRVSGGEVTLARILENVLVNACEGNGSEHASHVRLSVAGGDENPYVRLTVHDDGPGFAQDLIDKPVRGFVTTKEGGTGLGLYTLERLARASGGRVTRENDGGARVTIDLLRADAVDAERESTASENAASVTSA